MPCDIGNRTVIGRVLAKHDETLTILKMVTKTKFRSYVVVSETSMISV